MHVNYLLDNCDRSVANVLIGKLDGKMYHPPHLVTCEFMEAPPNNESITTLIEESLDNLGILGIGRAQDRNLFKALLSDAAAYMVKTGKNLKECYQSLIHITCLVHALHRVCEQVRAMLSKLNKLITTVKQIYRKSPKRMAEWKAAYSKVPLPPRPILTRWGTWVEAGIYYDKYFDIVHDMVNRLKEEDAASIPKDSEF